MNTEGQRDRGHPASTIDRALRRIVAEIVDGLRHGYFQFGVTSEVISHGRRRLMLQAGKTYQFVIPGDECAPTDRPNSPDDRSLVDACASHGPDNNPCGGSQDNTNDS